MKRLYMLLAVCLVFPVSVFALDTTSTDIIESGIEEMMLQPPTG